METKLEEIKRLIREKLTQNEERVYIFVHKQILEDALKLLESIEEPKPAKTTRTRTKKVSKGE